VEGGWVERPLLGGVDAQAGNDGGDHPSVAWIVRAHLSLLGQRRRKICSRVTMISSRDVIEIKDPSMQRAMEMESSTVVRHVGWD
jgi:hypothetical protein